MCSSPCRLGDDIGGLDAALRQPDSNTADLLDRPADQRRGVVRILFRSSTLLDLTPGRAMLESV